MRPSRVVQALPAVLLAVASTGCSAPEASDDVSPFGPDPCTLVDPATAEAALGAGSEVYAAGSVDGVDTCVLSNDTVVADVGVPVVAPEPLPELAGSRTVTVAGQEVALREAVRRCRLVWNHEPHWLLIDVRRSPEPCEVARTLAEAAIVELDEVDVPAPA